MTTTELGATVPASLRESPAFDLEDLLETGVVGLQWIAPDGTVLWANRSEYERLGYGLDEYVGHHIGDFQVDEHARDLLLAHLARGESLQRLELTLRARDGSTRSVLLSTSPRYDDQGRLLHTRGVSQDVTEQRRVEAELRACQRALELSREQQAERGERVSGVHELAPSTQSTTEQLQMIADSIPALVAYVSADRRYRFVNSAYERWFDVPRERIIGTAMAELLGAAGFAIADEHVARALAGESVSFDGSVDYPRLGRRTVRATYVPHRDAAGKVAGFVVLVSDVSDERESTRAREDLLKAERETRERLAVLSRASEVLSRSLDYERTLESVTQIMLPLLGDFAFFDLREGDAVRRIARAHDAPSIERLLTDIQLRNEQAGEDASESRSSLQAQVDERWLRSIARDEQQLQALQALAIRSLIVVPLTYQGTTLGSLTLFFGSSGRRHTPSDLALAEEIASRAAAAVVNARLFKEARDAIGVRDDFLSMAGHELRTPLTALQLQILSITKVMDQPDGVQKVLSRAEKASRNVLRLSNLVNELLDISRITAGRLKLERTPLDLSDAVQTVVARHADELSKNGCEMRLQTDQGVQGIWDSMRVEQITTNLLTNALKYGKGKPIEVKVERGQGVARLIVRDHGIGIPAEDQQRIFQRFERAVSSRHFGGLGFGLWIARQLVDAHGGTIRVTSESGAGATFEVELPLHPPDEVQA